MTVPSESARSGATGNGTTATYSGDFKIFDEDDIEVIVTETATNEPTTLTKTTDYTVANVGVAAGFTITLVDASQDWIDGNSFLATGWTISMTRSMELIQDTSITTANTSLPENVEGQLDKTVMLIQQQQDELDRSLKLPAGEDPDDFDMTLPPLSTRANTVATWDADGNPSTTTLETISTAAPVTATYVTLSTDSTLPNERVLTGTSGVIEVTDNGAGNTVVIDSSLATALKVPSYVTLGTTSTLTNERVLTGTAGQITVTDNGAGGTVVLSLVSTVAAPKLFQARMTLSTGVPVTTTDQTAKTTLYLTPYGGNAVALFDGSSTWASYAMSELSIAVPNTSSTMYDLWVYNNGGTPALEALAWTNDTTRATALTTQDGVLVKTGATTRRYCGSFRTTGSSGQTEDSLAKRYVWNYYNRVERIMKAVDTTNSWTYTTAAFQQANASTANQLDFVVGVSEDAVSAMVRHSVTNSGTVADVAAGIGLDSTTANSAILTQYYTVEGLNYAAVTVLGAEYKGYPGVGRHYLAWLEYSEATGTTTWYGDNGSTLLQTGILGSYRG